MFNRKTENKFQSLVIIFNLKMVVLKLVFKEKPFKSNNQIYFSYLKKKLISTELKSDDRF